jgi:hypothetical protein
MTLLDAREQQSSSLIGEDTWELFEAIEESFGVDLGDYYELSGITIRELAQKIETLADYSDESTCLSSVAFYKVRRAFESLSIAPRRSLRPATHLAPLLAWRTRDEQWRLLQERLDLQVPELRAPGWTLLFCIAAPVALLISLRFFLGLPASGTIIALCSIPLIVLAFRVVIPLTARVIPSDCETLGGLAKAVLALNYADFARVHGSSLEQGVLPALRWLVAMQTCIEIGKISSETRIPSDLNIY